MIIIKIIISMCGETIIFSTDFEIAISVSK